MSKPIAYNLYPTLLDAFAWYKKSEDENAFQEFVDKVNRVKDLPSDAMLRGIAFESRVDAVAYGMMDLAEGASVRIHDIECPGNIIRSVADRFRGAVRQVEVEALLDTEYGTIRVYGKVDEILADCGYDIKTTWKYEFPKYLHHFQHLVYLEALRPMNINRFMYVVTDFRDVYEEEYGWTQDGRARLVDECCHLVEFLEKNRALITDKKVFALA